MAPSQVSGKKMRTLLFGVILGIFAVVHSVTSNVVLLDDDRGETEEYFMDQADFLSPSSSALPKRPETSEAPQQSSSEVKSNLYEGSGDDNYNSEILFPQQGSDHLGSTPQSVDHNHSSQYPVTESRESEVFEGSGSEIMFPHHGRDHLGSTPQSVDHNHSSQYPFTESKESEVFEESGSEILFPHHERDHLGSTPQSVDHNHSSRYPFTESEESEVFEGSGSKILFPQHGESTTQGGSPTQRPYTETTTSMFEDSLNFNNFAQVNDSEGSGSAGSSDEGQMSPVSTTQTSSLTRNAPRMVPGFDKRGPEASETQDPQTRTDVNQSTPGWIIIVAFIVGVAALVMLCAAIATRDKWNRPNQASKLETKTNSSNQQRELEMETFLQKDQPRENGEASEYTVIQLDDLPDQHSLQ